GVSRRSQRARRDLEDSGLVLDDEHGRLAAYVHTNARLIGRYGRVLGARDARLRTREQDVECRAFSGGALHGDRSARLADDAVASGEAEPRTLAGLLRREKGLEDALPSCGIHADAGIADDQTYVLAGLEAEGRHTVRAEHRNGRRSDPER